VSIVASTSAIALAGTVLLIAIQADHADFSPVQTSPALMFGISLHYAVLRLPLGVASLIGWLVAAAAMVWAPTVAGGSEVVRHAVYMCFANLFGMVFCRLVEMRERELYRQRRRSESAEATARLRQAASEESNTQKTRLIAAVSHDLRQPMTAALAHLEVVHSRLTQADLSGAQSAVERAQSAVSLLGTTLDHLLTAARYDSGTEALSIGYVDLADVLRDVHDTYIGEAERSGVRLRVRLPRKRVALETDARSITRVLGNLVSNAIKFSDPAARTQPTVLVAVRFCKSACRIQVIDNGIGIDPDRIQEIWRPFVQLNTEERDRERGLGLGLFLVRQIIDQLPGHAMTAHSRPNHGSVFTLSIPAVQIEGRHAVSVEQSVQQAKVDSSPLAGAFVVVIEDDRDTRVAIVDLLEAWGGLPVATPSVSKLEGSLNESERLVDAIICDYRLAGGTNGIDAIATLRERLGYAPHAVLITGEPDIAPIRARAGPETTVLHKPFPPDSLARPLIRAVQAARQLEEG
jgi:signal transduction histidine kinase/CheY-like chemotaxis protein